ncbi:MAG: 2-C-methyl-D-erythritol 4-phosphate cytidylyltransferase [Opitutales bacterium]
MVNAVILLAAGRGSRMGQACEDKITLTLAGKPVISHSFEAFAQTGLFEHFVVVYRDREQQQALSAALSQCNLHLAQISWVCGGKERQDSVFHALSEVSLLVDAVFMHDCARPAVRPEAIRRVAQAVRRDGAAVLAHRVTDTIKEVACDKSDFRQCQLTNLNRAHLWAMQTPQAFEREAITEAYRKLRLDGILVTDDTAAYARQGKSITLIENPHPNPKLTTASDMAYLDFLLRQPQPTA